MAGLLREGDRVDVTGGALAGLSGAVLSVDPFAGRAQVDVLIGGRAIRLEFRLAELRRGAAGPDAEPGAAADSRGRTGFPH